MLLPCPISRTGVRSRSDRVSARSLGRPPRETPAKCQTACATVSAPSSGCPASATPLHVPNWAVSFLTGPVRPPGWRQNRNKFRICRILCLEQCTRQHQREARGADTKWTGTLAAGDRCRTWAISFGLVQRSSETRVTDRCIFGPQVARAARTRGPGMDGIAPVPPCRGLDAGHGRISDEPAYRPAQRGPRRAARSRPRGAGQSRAADPRLPPRLPAAADGLFRLWRARASST